MNQAVTAIGHELAKDKWLLLALIIILLWAYIHTHNEALSQLLVTAVGGFLGLMRSGATTQNIASGEGSVARSEPVTEPKI